MARPATTAVRDKAPSTAVAVQEDGCRMTLLLLIVVVVDPFAKIAWRITSSFFGYAKTDVLRVPPHTDKDQDQEEDLS